MYMSNEELIRAVGYSITRCEQIMRASRVRQTLRGSECAELVMELRKACAAAQSFQSRLQGNPAPKVGD